MKDNPIRKDKADGNRISILSSLIWVSFIVLTAACHAPTTYGPQLSQQELAAEQAAQRALVVGQAEVKRQPMRRLSREQMEEQMLRVAYRVSRAGKELCSQIRPPGATCDFRFFIEHEKDAPDDGTPRTGGLNAYTDGRTIVITPDMMRFVQNDEELALVIAHEFAHAIMEHPQATASNAMAGGLLGTAIDILASTQGYNTQGTFGKVGANAGVLRYSVAFENEADYIGLYIFARSGFSVARAENFWRRFSIEDPEKISGGATHPSNAARFIAMQKTIQEIQFKREHGLPLVPDFRPDT